MGGKLERRIIIGAVLASALIAAIVAVVILIPKERTGPRAELPTLYVGDEWVYRLIDNITYTLNSRVVGEEMVDNENSYVIETSYDPPWRGNFSCGTTWVKKAAGDTMKAEMSGKYRGTPFTTTWTYAYQYLGLDRWPIEVGKEYSMVMTVTVSTSTYKPTVETENLRAKVEKM